MQAFENRVRIVVFDSGVGGLSVLDSIRSRMPRAHFIFCGDTLHFPYGTKDDDTLVDIVTKTAGKLIEAYQPHIFVVACNTASTLVLDALRTQFALPFVGTVPAIKPAAGMSQSKVIGVLATEATVRRPYLSKLIDDFAPDCTVIKHGSRGLVQLAERKVRGEAISLDEVKQEILPLFASHARGLDTVVLGCTHFPLLTPEFVAVAPWPVTWLDSGGAIAARVVALVSSNPEWAALDHNSGEESANNRAIFTAETCGQAGSSVSQAARRFLASLGITRFETLKNSL